MWVAATRVHSSDPALFEEVFAIGSQKITCIDNCYELITHLKKKHDAAYGASVEFICADARKLQDVFKEPCFDTIFDKGTFDFILAGDVSINHATKYLEEINRILTNNGTFIVLSTLDVATTAKYFNKVSSLLTLDELESEAYRSREARFRTEGLQEEPDPSQKLLLPLHLHQKFQEFGGITHDGGRKCSRSDRRSGGST